MADPFKGFESLTSPSQRWVVVVPNDVTPLAVVPKALYFSAGGDVALVGDDGVAATFTVIAGQTLRVRPTIVKVTGTTVAAGKIIQLN